jgi:hypothetical protein
VSSVTPSITRLRACWVTHAESGCSVTPATWTFLRGDLDEEQHVERLQPDGLHSEEVGGQRSLGLRPQELRPRRTRAARRRAEASGLQDPSDRGGANVDPELAELTLDPWIPPPGVLPSHPNDEFADLGVDGWPPGSAVGVGPLPPNQFPVPAEQRLRRDQERRPPLARESARQGRQHRTVERTEPRPSYLPSQDLQLVAEDQDLEVLGPIPPRKLAASGRETAQEGEGEPAQHGRRMVPMPWSGCESRFALLTYSTTRTRPRKDEGARWRRPQEARAGHTV